MKIEGREEVEIPPAQAWRMINDPEVLKGCTPGLQRLERTSPDHFDAEVVLALPAVSGSFTGGIDYLERAEPERLRLKLQGKGGPGFVNGTATIALAPSPKGTEFRYEADLQIGGQIARLGQRMISGVTKEMAGQFFEAFERRGRLATDGAAAEGAEPPALPPQPSPLFAFFQLLWRTLLNLLGLSKRS